jgi:hypothetical protein
MTTSVPSLAAKVVDQREQPHQHQRRDGDRDHRHETVEQRLAQGDGRALAPLPNEKYLCPKNPATAPAVRAANWENAGATMKTLASTKNTHMSSTSSPTPVRA